MLKNFDWELFFSLLVIGLPATLFLCVALLYFTLVRRVQKELKKHCGTEDYSSWVYRAVTYARYVVFPHRLAKDRYPLMDYQGFDFHSFASPLEKVLSYIFIYSFFGCISIAILVYLADLLGYIQLE